MKNIKSLHPDIEVVSEYESKSGASLGCDFQGAPLSLYIPFRDTLSTESGPQLKLDSGQVDKLYRPNEEGPCGGVNMAEMVLDRLIEYRDENPQVAFNIYGNHPPSKGAERAELYQVQGVDFDTPIEDVEAGSVYLFSAHGADPRQVELAKSRKLHVVDTTCPLVDKIYSHVRKAVSSGDATVSETDTASTAVVYLAPLYKRDHPEIAGTRGVVETAGFKFIPVRDHEEAMDLVEGKQDVGPEHQDLHGVERLLITGLTTNNASEVLEIGQAVTEVSRTMGYTALQYSERDVCRTVQYRQQAVDTVVGDNLVDEVFILGAVESNNTNELVRKTLATLALVPSHERRLRRITFGNHYEDFPLYPRIKGDVLLMSGASTGMRNVRQTSNFLNPNEIIRVGNKEKLDLFSPLGKHSIARRILADDFSWLHE